MYNLSSKSKLFLKKNASTILTSVGAVGVVATSVTAVKATPKALRLLEKAKEEKGDDLTKWETIRVAGPTYIPTVSIGLATVLCIFGANVVNQRQQASLISAYALLDQKYKGYKKKVAELYGDEAAKEVRDEMAKDQYKEEDIQDEDDGKQLFYDEYSRRYFRATNETVLSAEYAINKILAEDCGATLNEFYDLLGIDSVDYGDEVGWSSSQMFEMYWSSWIDFYHERVKFDDGLECWIISMTEPVPGFADY